MAACRARTPAELISQDDLNFINSQLDMGLMERWGFETVTSVAQPAAVSPLVKKQARGGLPLAPSRRRAMTTRGPKPRASSAEEVWADQKRVSEHMKKLTFLEAKLGTGH